MRPSFFPSLGGEVVGDERGARVRTARVRGRRGGEPRPRARHGGAPFPAVHPCRRGPGARRSHRRGAGVRGRGSPDRSRIQDIDIPRSEILSMRLRHALGDERDPPPPVRSLLEDRPPADPAASVHDGHERTRVAGRRALRRRPTVGRILDAAVSLDRGDRGLRAREDRVGLEPRSDPVVPLEVRGEPVEPPVQVDRKVADHVGRPVVMVMISTGGRKIV